MTEKDKRLKVTFEKHNDWLRKYTYNLTESFDLTDELVSELYLYLAEKGNEKLYWKDGGYNLGYCTKFIKSRFFNSIKKRNKFVDKEINDDLLNFDSNEEYNESIDNTYEEIKNLLKSKQTSPKWVSAKIAELYYFGKGFTIEGLAKEIGVSKSTVFLHIKSMKKEIKKTVKNPYKEEE